MSGERITFGTFGDFLHTGTEFIDWMQAAFHWALIPQDYWAPELGQLPFFKMLPVGYLDRNEILLIPRWNGTLISISWSMPIGIGFHGTRGHMIRGAANCWTCQNRIGGLESFRCYMSPSSDGKTSQTARFALDLGQCPAFVSADPGPLPAYRVPVWWRDSDWPVAPARYSPLAFDVGKINHILSRPNWVTTPITVEPPVRKTSIPLSPLEQGDPPGSTSPSRAGWLDFLRTMLDGAPGLNDFLAEACEKEFTIAGGD